MTAQSWGRAAKAFLVFRYHLRPDTGFFHGESVGLGGPPDQLELWATAVGESSSSSGTDRAPQGGAATSPRCATSKVRLAHPFAALGRRRLARGAQRMSVSARPARSARGPSPSSYPV